jgi:hypothetical protein
VIAAIFEVPKPSIVTAEFRFNSEILGKAGIDSRSTPINGKNNVLKAGNGRFNLCSTPHEDARR